MEFKIHATETIHIFLDMAFRYLLVTPHLKFSSMLNDKCIYLSR